jgi:predicted RNA-binding protein YlxR (DUF448 family)/ribosomal protein L30E
LNETLTDAEENVAERMCIVTREVRDEAQLIRFVRGPEGAVVPDINRKLPGRGVWVSLSRAKVAEAVKRKAFSRGLGETSAAGPELPDQVGGLLRKAAVSYISLAKKAGDAVAGNAKVEEMVAAGRARLVIHAQEAAQNGRQKIDKLSGPSVETLGFFTSNELDLAFGRANVIHAAVAKGGLAEKLLQATRRAEAYEA